jgi:hypothetical protein
VETCDRYNDSCSPCVHGFSGDMCHIG